MFIFDGERGVVLVGDTERTGELDRLPIMAGGVFVLFGVRDLGDGLRNGEAVFGGELAMLGVGFTFGNGERSGLLEILLPLKPARSELDSPFKPREERRLGKGGAISTESVTEGSG